MTLAGGTLGPDMPPSETRATERRYRGMTAADRRDDRRRRLLDAALDQFGTRGYAATTIEDVCTAAGVTARHLYEHFASREELLLAVYDRIIDEHLAVIAGALSDEGTLEEVARIGAESALGHWASDERRARIAFLEVVGVRGPVEQRRLEVLEQYAAFIAATADRLAERGLITHRDNRLLAGHAVVGAISQLCVHWLSTPDRPPIEVVVDELVELQLALLRHP
jgi:AcrR family transcriptional regulator